MIQLIIEVTVLPNETIGILKRKEVGSNDLVVDELSIDDAHYLFQSLGISLKEYYEIKKRQEEMRAKGLI